MRFSSRTLLHLAAAVLAAAGPFPRDNLHDVGFSYLMHRGCDSYCGADNQYCCSSGETCTTISDVATCLSDGSYYGEYTTTWTVTQTYTSTIATLWDSAPEATSGVDCVPKNSQQEACGTICCAGWQTCAYDGQCSAKPGMEGGTTVVVTSNGKVTTQYSAPYRVTGTTTITTEGVRSDTATETGSTETSTATNDSDTLGAGGSGGTGGHLSAGAIAGIVIGTIAGVALLLLLCFCCIARGLWVALFGKKSDRDDSRERVDVVTEHYSRHGSRPPTAHSKRPSHKGWFGGGGPASAASRRDSEKRKSSGAKWLGLAGLAATLLALLNMKKDKRPASKPSRSRSSRSRSSRGSARYSDSYFSYSDYDDPSKPSH